VEAAPGTFGKWVAALEAEVVVHKICSRRLGGRAAGGTA
jgi:hypothetical protein